MKGEKIAWEEDLPLTVAEEYEALVETIRFTEGFGLLFVECSPRQGTEIMEKIRLELPQEKAEILSLDKTVYNFYNRVKELPLLAEIDILFVTGFEYSLYQYEDEMKERGWDSNEIISISRRGVPPVLVNLNQQREKFRDDFDICFVFLLPRFAIDYMIKLAPDFFDWRSGLFLFPKDEETLRAESLEVCGKELIDYTKLPPKKRKYEWVKIKNLIDEDEGRLSADQKANLLLKKAILDREFGKYEIAILTCNKALEIKPENYEAWKIKGFILDNLGRYEQAIAAYDKALEIKPDSYEVWNSKGIALSDLGRYEQAIAAYNKALEIKPDDIFACILKGIALSDSGIYELTSAYKKSLKIQVNDYESWNRIGNTLFDFGRYKEAINVYEKALDIKPSYHHSWNNIGNAMRKLGRPKEAIDAYEKALEITPTYDLAWNNKGVVLYDLGRYEEALAAYEKSLEISSDKPIIWKNKGDVLRKLGRYEQAIKIYEKALEIQPHYPGAIINLGFIKYEIGNINEAIANWEAASEINNQNVEPKLAIAVALYNKSEIIAALAMAETVLKSDKNWGNLQRLKKENWGEKLLADAAKLLENPQIKALLSQS